MFVTFRQPLYTLKCAQLMTVYDKFRPEQNGKTETNALAYYVQEQILMKMFYSTSPIGAMTMGLMKTRITILSIMILSKTI